MKQITIYGKPNCKHCKDAIKFCQAHSWPINYRCTSNELDFQEMRRRNPDAKTFPQIFIGQQLIGGCSDLLLLETRVIQQMLGE